MHVTPFIALLGATTAAALALASSDGGAHRRPTHNRGGHRGSTCGQAYDECQGQGQSLCCPDSYGRNCHTMTSNEYHQFYDEPIGQWCPRKPKKYGRNVLSHVHANHCRQGCKQNILDLIPVQDCTDFDN